MKANGASTTSDDNLAELARLAHARFAPVTKSVLRILGERYLDFRKIPSDRWDCMAALPIAGNLPTDDPAVAMWSYSPRHDPLREAVGKLVVLSRDSSTYFLFPNAAIPHQTGDRDEFRRVVDVSRNALLEVVDDLVCSLLEIACQAPESSEGKTAMDRFDTLYKRACNRRGGIYVLDRKTVAVTLAVLEGLTGGLECLGHSDCARTFRSGALHETLTDTAMTHLGLP